jgi:hypothetical protein
MSITHTNSLKNAALFMSARCFPLLESVADLRLSLPSGQGRDIDELKMTPQDHHPVSISSLLGRVLILSNVVSFEPILLNFALLQV